MPMDIVYCPWEPATYLFISENVPPLIHYSHFIAIFAAMSIALLVFINDPRRLLSRLFLVFSSLFTTWALLDVILWATNDPGVVRFAWSMQVLIEPITYALAFYLFYLFVRNQLPRFHTNLAIVLLLTPLVLLLPTTLNLEALYLSTCEFDEGPLAAYYTYFLNLLFVILIFVTGYRYFPEVQPRQKRTVIYFGAGLVTFLLAFTSGNILGSFTDDWTLSQYGLFGMPVFASIIAYCIVKYRAFQVQVAGAQILVVILWVSVGAMLFVDFELTRLVAGATLIITTVAGFMLIRSVRNEIAQRRQLETLTTQLERANTRLTALDKQKSEFVSIASHQLRSPLTSIRGYASLLLEESYGKLPPQAIEPIERIEQSSKLMAIAIEDYLNVSRIESGNMKYTLTDFNLRDEVDHICDDLRPEALKHGLILLFRSDLNSRGIINADIGKTVQVVQNLIHNAIKYTEKGSIKVLVRDDITKKRIYVDVIDTGIGMNEETLTTIFQKFERAKNANSVDIHGTGLGLYVSLRIAQAMGGTIDAHSDGDGKGSRFTLELPLAL